GWARQAAARGDSGGSSARQTAKILSDCKVRNTRQPYSLEGLIKNAQEGKGQIVGVDGKTLQTGEPPHGDDHAVTVTGVRYDENGNVDAIIINNTGAGTCGQAVPLNRWEAATAHSGDMNVTESPIF